MPIDPATLKTELTTDPANLGYASPVAAGNDVTLADLLNQARAGATYQVYRGVVPSYEVINNTDPADWVALTAAEKQRYQTLTGAGQVDVSQPNVRNTFGAMFAAGTATRANLTAMAVRQASRAEILFGTGTVVTVADISFALRGQR